MIDENVPRAQNENEPSFRRALFSLIGIISVLILSSVFLQLLGQKIITNYDLSDSGMLNANGEASITALAIDANGQPWIGSSRGLFTLTPEGIWNTYTTLNSKLPSGTIAALVIDNNKRVWVGTTSGLGMLTAGRVWETLLDERVFALATDQQGNLWVATEKKISLLSDGQWTDYASEESGLSIPPYGLVVDQNRQLWTTDRFHLDILTSDGKWIKAISSNVIKPRYNGIRALTIDNHNRLWAGTEDGLLECTHQQCALYYPNLTNDLEIRRPVFPYNIRVLAFDRGNRLWGSNGNDLYILDLSLASLFERFLSVQWFGNLLLFVLTYVFGVRQFPRKNSVLIGALGGGIASIVLVSWRMLLIFYAFPALLFFTLPSLVIGSVAGFIGGKLGGEIGAYLSGGAGAAVLYVLFLLAFAQ